MSREVPPQPLTLTEEAFQERRRMLLRMSRWMRVAADTGDADRAMTGLLEEIHREEVRKPIARAGLRLRERTRERKAS